MTQTNRQVNIEAPNSTPVRKRVERKAPDQTHRKQTNTPATPGQLQGLLEKFAKR